MWHAHLTRDSRAGRPCYSVKLRHYRSLVIFALYLEYISASSWCLCLLEVGMKSRCTHTKSLSWCWILLALLIAPGSLSAQENLQGSAPPIEMLKLKWEKEVRLPRNFDPSVIPTGGTFGDPATRVTTTSPGIATAGASSGTPAARTAG